MAIKVKAGIPKAIRVAIAAGVAIRVRPATAFEVELAKANIVKLVAGLVAGETAAMLATVALGEEFRSADFTRDEWRAAAQDRLALLELAAVCIVDWDGFVGEDDKPLPVNRATIAMVMREDAISRAVKEVIVSAVHERLAEKNGSSASPAGAVKAGPNTAPIASPQGTPAPPAD